MFTGIIQNLGNVKNYSNGELEILTSLDLSDCEIGSSICCNGVCLTATEISYKDKQFIFKVDVGDETQERTNFSHNKSELKPMKNKVCKYSISLANFSV